MRTETLVVGAGLSGLALARTLAQRGRDFHVLEARNRVGGRVLTEGGNGASFDLGPAWFWPGQPRMSALTQELGLRVFEQYAQGELSFEDENGRVQRGRGYASMAGSFRLDGGLSAMTDALADSVGHDQISLAAPVTEIARTDKGVCAQTENGLSVEAEQVVLALPPRVAATLVYAPNLAAETVAAMTSIPTWMAGQAKAVAVYARPFWRDAGLSGDAMSRRGPMVEIHDASTADGAYAALFGFIGVPPEARRDEVLLRAAIVDQLGRIFGPEAGSPLAVHIKDWAFDPFTSTDHDLKPLFAHPRYGLPDAMRDLWEGRLIFGGTEVAPQFGGYLEGALEAAEIAMATIEREAEGV